MNPWLCEAGCGDPVADHRNTPTGWQCLPGCPCTTNPVRTVNKKLLGSSTQGGLGGGVDVGEATTRERKRRAGILFAFLAGTVALAAAGAYYFGDDYLASKQSPCALAADHHLHQAEQDPNNSTQHYTAADTYLKAELYGHKCTWPPETNQ